MVRNLMAAIFLGGFALACNNNSAGSDNEAAHDANIRTVADASEKNGDSRPDSEDARPETDAARDARIIAVVTDGGETDATNVDGGAQKDAEVGDGALSTDATANADTLATDGGASADGGDAAAVPEVYLEVRLMDVPESAVAFMEDGVQVVPDREADGTLHAALYEACARGGPLTLASVTLEVMGNSGFPMLFRLNDREFMAEPSNDFTFLLDDEEHIALGEEDCVEVATIVALPVPDWVSSVRPHFKNAETEENAEVRFAGANPNFGGGLRSWLTVFEPHEGLIVSSSLSFDRQDVIVPRDAQFTSAGQFSICSETNTFGEVTSVHFALAGTPIEAAFPLRLEISYASYDSNWVNLPGGFADNYLTGDLLEWRAQRGPQHEPEILKYGACLWFNVTLLFVPGDAETLTMSITAVDANVPVNSNIFGFVSDFDDPIPDDRLVFVDPPPRLDYLDIRRSWPHDNGQLNYFMFEGMPSPCMQFGVGGPGGGEGAEPEECPMWLLDASPFLSDVREPVVMERMRFNLHAENLRDAAAVPFRVRLQARRYNIRWGEDPDGIDEEVDVEDGDNFLEYRPGWELSQNAGNGWQLRITPVDPLPMADILQLVSPRVRFDVVAMEATYFDQPLPVFMEGPLQPGGGEWQPHDLPDEGSWINFHDPELWLSGLEVNPPLVVSRAEYNERTPGQEINLFGASVRAPYGSVSLCTLRFLHNSDKDVPPVQDLLLRINGEAFGLDEWNREEAIFRLPRERCPEVWSSGTSYVEVVIINPTENTRPGLPLFFEWVEVEAYPRGLEEEEDWLLPLITAQDGRGNRSILSEDDRIPGRAVAIVD